MTEKDFEIKSGEDIDVIDTVVDETSTADYEYYYVYYDEEGNMVIFFQNSYSKLAAFPTGILSEFRWELCRNSEILEDLVIEEFRSMQHANIRTEKLKDIKKYLISALYFILLWCRGH